MLHSIMPNSIRQVVGAVSGAVAAFIGYKLAFAGLAFISNDILRTILSGIPGAILGIGIMYLILRGEKDET